MKDLDLEDYGKRISLEMGIPIQMKVEGIGFPLQSSFVGMEIDQYLIIKAPPQFTSVKFKFVPGLDIVIRYLYHGTVFGFQTKLIEYTHRPVKLLFLEYPRIIEQHDLRNQKRAHSLFPAKIKIKQKVNNGVIIDISNEGCRCHILASPKEELPSAQIDEKIILTCKFPGVHGDHEILGIIRNLKKSRKEIIIGIEFSQIEVEVHDHIIKYIYAVEHYPANVPLS